MPRLPQLGTDLPRHDQNPLITCLTLTRRARFCHAELGPMEDVRSARRRLAAHMDSRREDLRLTWAEVASLAGVSRETLRQIRTGEGEIRPLTRRGIEDALQWASGSIAIILDGGEPTPREEGPSAPPEQPPGEDLTPFERRILAEMAEMRSELQQIRDERRGEQGGEESRAGHG